MIRRSMNKRRQKIALPIRCNSTKIMANQANAFDATVSSGVWEGYSYRRGGIESDETKWTDISLVFTDIRKGGVGGLPRGEAPAWGRDEPNSAIFRLCGKGLSHWRGRQIPFALRGFVEPSSSSSSSSGNGGGSVNVGGSGSSSSSNSSVGGGVSGGGNSNGSSGGGNSHVQGLLRVTLIKRHLGAYSNVVQYEGKILTRMQSDGRSKLRQQRLSWPQRSWMYRPNQTKGFFQLMYYTKKKKKHVRSGCT